jgi:hypothetical protein
LLVVVCDADVGVFRDPFPYFLEEITAKPSECRVRVFSLGLRVIVRVVKFVHEAKKVRGAGSCEPRSARQR